MLLAALFLGLFVFGAGQRTIFAQDDTTEMLDYDGPVLFDVLVERHENCLPMIPSGKPHNEMILPDFKDDIGAVIDEKGRQLV